MTVQQHLQAICCRCNQPLDADDPGGSPFIDATGEIWCRDCIDEEILAQDEDWTNHGQPEL